MAITNATYILRRASRERYSVGAFNVTSIVQMMAVVDEAVARKAPVIIQTSVTPSKFYGARVLVAAFRALAGSAPVPVCLHLDHCTDEEYCRRCAEAGYTNIMIDASEHPYEENVRITAAVCGYVHRLSTASVEGELGKVGGVEDEIEVSDEDAVLCDPSLAVDFVRRTGVDLFAPAIGTAHGVYKTKNPRVDFARFERTRELLDDASLNVPLVVHGGTGLPESTIRRLVEAGGAKFNVSTELKHVLLETTYEYGEKHRTEFNPGKVDAAVRVATRQMVGRWMDLLGCSGKA